MRLSKKDKKDFLDLARNRRLTKAIEEADRKAAKYPKLTFLQYIRFLDSYQNVFGQFPVSKEKIKGSKFIW